MGSKPIHFNDIPLDIKKNIILGYVRTFACTSLLDYPLNQYLTHNLTADQTTRRSQVIMPDKQGTT